MVEIIGNQIYRDGIKIGWFAGDGIFDEAGKKIGYFSAEAVFDAKGEIMARIEGDRVFSGNRTIDLEQIIRSVSGVGISDSGKVAIAMFLGD